MINNEIKKILDEQQSEIINDNNKYLCVSACPGAGKTYTLIKKMENAIVPKEELEKKDNAYYAMPIKHTIKRQKNAPAERMSRRHSMVHA